MISILDNALVFLIQTLFNLYIFILVLRMLLQWLGAHFYNPVSQFVIRLTNPVLIPLRKLLPAFRGLDIPALFLLVLLQFIKLALVFLLAKGMMPGVTGLLIAAFGDMLELLVSIFFYAIIIKIILSWVAPFQRNPFADILNLLTEPLLFPARRLIPPIAGFDISAIPVLIILQLMSITISNPLIQFGVALASK